MIIGDVSVRRGQPRHEYVSTLSDVDKHEFRRLLQAIIPAMIEGRKQIYVRWSYLVKFPDDFPKGNIIKKEGYTDVRSMRVEKVLKWLYKHNIIPFTRKDLANKIRNESHRMRRYFEINVDSGSVAAYNVDSVLEEAVALIDSEIKQQKAADEVSAKPKPKRKSNKGE